MTRPTQHDRVEAAFANLAQAYPELRGAVLVRKQDDEGGDFPLQAHRIYRSAAGNHFLFICTAGQPGFLTLLTRERAENALRSSPAIFRAEFGRDP
jgi:hypothetical protein